MDQDVQTAPYDTQLGLLNNHKKIITAVVILFFLIFTSVLLLLHRSKTKLVTSKTTAFTFKTTGDLYQDIKIRLKQEFP